MNLSSFPKGQHVATRTPRAASNFSMTKLRCPVCSKEKHKISFKCGSCGTEVLVERHIHEDAQAHLHPHSRERERYRLHPKRA